MFKLYRELQRLVDQCSKKEILLLIGDFNAKVGEDTDRRGCGTFGLGVQNERGEMLLDGLETNKLIAVNTCFRHRKGQRWTWIQPGGRCRNQIDFIVTRRKDSRECEDARALPSADCGSDHQMV